MFSIAAINDTDTKGEWEALAPAKEAQEFHLTQTYHEGLLQLQAKEYTKARELLQSVLKDPLVSNAQVDNNASDGHLLQLRFLALKNLASVFLQQGPVHYESALGCYLQAVEIDAKDSVVWNQLGTLSCTMGLLSISRWAFEQGLFCSPNNWNCMEKLLEVLIAIGDEVACLSVAELILRHWPSHARALHVKNTMEESDLVPFAPRGIDKLEPKHVRLKFPDKRKSTADAMDEHVSMKRRNQNIELHLVEASWSALLDAILSILIPKSARGSDQGVGCYQDGSENDELGCRPAKVLPGTTSMDGDSAEPTKSENSHYTEKLDHSDSRIHIHLPVTSEIVMDSLEGKGISTVDNVSVSDSGSEKASIMKEKEVGTDEEHPQERRSTRLERLRSRRPGKEELDFPSSKDLSKVVRQSLEPFIVDRLSLKNPDFVGNDSVHDSSDVVVTLSELEFNDVIRFIKEASNNYGASHMAHLFLEEIAHRSLPYQDFFVKLLELEKLTRQWGQDRSVECNLFLAELYYDFGASSANGSHSSHFFSEASYHLCKVIELVALDHPASLTCLSNLDIDSGVQMEKNDTTRFTAPGMAENGDINLNDCSQKSSSLNREDSVSSEPLVYNALLSHKCQFWVRFFWLSGHLSIFSGDKVKAFKEFSISLSLLKNDISDKDTPSLVPLPHCKLVRGLTVERVLHEIHLLEVESLLGKTTSEMIEKRMYLECVKLLAPLLLTTKDIYLDLLPGVCREGEGITSVELLALDVLLLACENVKPMEIEVYLNCHRRKLQILSVGAGMVSLVSHKAPHKSSTLKTATAAAVELESVENMMKHWNHKVAEEVKAISQSASKIKNFIDQTGSSFLQDGPCALVSTIGDIQSLLLTIMCNIVGVFLGQKTSCLGMVNQTEQLESRCFVDAAIAFCKLQHLNPSIPVKTQVELIVSIHELLAEHGLCCAGKDSEGEEGTFLKLAIKHLLALDMKLKSIFHYSNRGLEMKQSDDLYCHNNHEKPFLDGSDSNSLPAAGIDTAEKGESGLLHKDASDEMIPEDTSTQEAPDKGGVVESLKDGADKQLHHKEEQVDSEDVKCGNHLIDVERKKVELGIDNALDQSFFCLYGLNLKCGSDSSCDDDLATHKNTSRGDYQTKEQCADVFQYILPYAKGSSRAGLVKLRRVLRAIRKHFPQPPEDLLKENSIDKFLDDPELCEEKLYNLVASEGNLEAIMNMIFPNGGCIKTSKALPAGSSESYSEVYGNLYYFLAQAEEMSATDKWPGFVLTKEGEDFVEQNANLFKYDLLYNPLHFESWQRLANIYDEEVDLLLNDGSKHKNVVEWRKHATLPQRVEVSRRRSRRCLLMSLALAKTPSQQSQIHEWLALVYYDSLQNVVPSYDQRSIVPTKDASWMILCQNSMKHFEKAFEHKPDWSHALYLGKLCEKLGYPYAKTFSHYNKAVTLNPSAVDPVYRMHASRLKLLYTCGKKNLDALRVITVHCFNQSTKESVVNMFGWTGQDLLQLSADKEGSIQNSEKDEDERCRLEEAWHMLYNDCLSALEICVEGDLKHFHKARYALAQGLHRRGEKGDLERAKDELSFCFRSSRSSFTINMWEIDGTVKKARRKTPGIGGNKRGLEASLPESSRKFITCIRKYTLLYLNLLEKTGDFGTLDRAYISLRTDKRFSLCLEDIAPVALGRYIQALTSSICHTETLGSSSISSCEQLLERMFNLFMDHGNLWTDLSSLPEMKSPEFSESNLYSYVHQYIHSLERDVRLDVLEGINEKIRKRFKNPKLSISNIARICKHASVAWCRTVLICLAKITPLPAENPGTALPDPVTCGSESGILLYVDLKVDELWSSLSFEQPSNSKSLENKWSQVLSRIKNVPIKQALEENKEAATSLLKCAYNFYRESSCGTFPSGINLYTVPSWLAVPGSCPPVMDGVETLDLSIPRKLLLWAYSLVHGRYSNILAVVKHCEENAKSRMKKGTLPSSALSQPSISSSTYAGSGAKERSNQDQCGEAEHNPSNAIASASLQEAQGNRDSQTVFSSDSHKALSTSLSLHQCNQTNPDRHIEISHEGDKDTS